MLEAVPRSASGVGISYGTPALPLCRGSRPNVGTERWVETGSRQPVDVAAAMGNRGAIERGQAMRIWIIGFAAFTFAAAGMAGPAPAQDDQARPRVARRAPLRIEVQPSRPPVRKCADWLVIEHRYAGDTIVPRTRCWWAPQ
jgi:hypothetical protein